MNSTLVSLVLPPILTDLCLRLIFRLNNQWLLPFQLFVFEFKQRWINSSSAHCWETLGFQSHAVLLSLCNGAPSTKTRGQMLLEQGKAARSNKYLLPPSSWICCVLTVSTWRDGRAKWSGRIKERHTNLNSYRRPLPELKMDSWRNASMAVSRDCDCSPPSNTWDSFTLVGHSDGATNTRPPSGREERGGRKRENQWVGLSVILQRQCPKGPSKWCVVDCHLSCSERQPNGFYCFLTSTTARRLIIYTDGGSALSSSRSLLS